MTCHILLRSIQRSFDLFLSFNFPAALVHNKIEMRATSYLHACAWTLLVIGQTNGQQMGKLGHVNLTASDWNCKGVRVNSLRKVECSAICDDAKSPLWKYQGFVQKIQKHNCYAFTFEESEANSAVGTCTICLEGKENDEILVTLNNVSSSVLAYASPRYLHCKQIFVCSERKRSLSLMPMRVRVHAPSTCFQGHQIAVPEACQQVEVGSPGVFGVFGNSLRYLDGSRGSDSPTREMLQQPSWTTVSVVWSSAFVL